MAKLVYPEHDENKYKAKIRFTPIFINPPGLSTETFDPSANGDFRNEPVRPVNTSTRTSITRPRTETFKDSITLYLPQQVTIADGMDYSNADLGVFGRAIEQGINAGTSVSGSFGDALRNTLSSLGDAVTGNMSEDAARAAISRFIVANPIANETTTAAVRSALRTTPMTNMRVIFRSVNLREFSFNFKFQPKSESEGETVKEIIKAFRTAMYPDTVKESTTGLPIAYKFPDIFDIKMFYQSEGKTLATKLKRCYLVGLTTNYNPSNMAFFETGDFTEYDLVLNFREEQQLTREDIEKGF